MIHVSTEHGPAAVHVDAAPARARSLLVLGHGAGGGVDAPDLLAVRDAAVRAGVTVVRVTQPYRVAGRRAPAPANQLDRAWRTVLAALPELVPGTAGLPLVVGGRSSGARVACRTAVDTGAVGVVALAFPVHPPGKPERSREAELATGLPTIVVNGDRDPFGLPTAPPAGVEVRVVSGARHDLRAGLDAAARSVADWLARQGWAVPAVTRPGSDR